jgi:hypothetical protein
MPAATEGKKLLLLPNKTRIERERGEKQEQQRKKSRRNANDDDNNTDDNSIIGHTYEEHNNNSSSYRIFENREDAAIFLEINTCE